MIALPFRKLYRIRIVRYTAEGIIMLGYLAALMMLAGVCG